MRIRLSIETKGHDEIAQRAKHEQEMHQTDTMHALCGAALGFLRELADRADHERHLQREEARRRDAGEGPPLQ